MNTIEILDRLGLKKHQAEVYEALVVIGPSIVSEIAKHTGLHRPLIYRALIPLQEKGLISTANKGKRRLYSAEPPEKLMNVFGTFHEGFQMALQRLQQIYNLNKYRPVVKFFEGKDGIRAVLNDLVDSQKRGDMFYRYSSKRAAELGNKYLPRDFRARIASKQLQRLMITDAPAKWQEKPRLTHFHKLLPQNVNLFGDNIAEFIYSNKVAFIDCDSETAIVIENPMIADFQRKLFRAFYNLLE